MNLKQIVEFKPYPDYADWWRLGPEFSRFMSEAIVSGWSALPHNDGDLGEVKRDLADYVQLVYGREVRDGLLEEFVGRTFTRPIRSGEFDALSYAFYKSAFDLIERHISAYAHPLDRERKLFTKRVGRVNFALTSDHLNLNLPSNLHDESDLIQLKDCIRRLGAFLTAQGYLRDHFDFLFAVDSEHAGSRIVQSESEFLPNLSSRDLAYALYEMGYPVILPSAVYLYHTHGEAQHHSSRTIEELFDLVGCDARETDNFDPTGYPSNLVVELWEIKSRRTQGKCHSPG